ncbi:MAG: helix-hairpin-helix domain-containing protein [Atribacterota bacterium]|nr:helix-hairpin-helix domain-containing protein [Atribacterota bacterium]MDD4895898.1 helix-hairpin-helix domain-containing protein [Atribacterota bacterium]MDD5636246.1 helix-hairpin-helix domain-containing protein [Atribacterota bacterium]
MFILSRQEKIILLFIIAVIIIIFGWKLYLQEKSSISIISANQENKEVSLSTEENTNEGICIIHISGAVQQPGVYQLSNGKRIIDAVKVAGGVTEKANLDAVNLAAHLHDGQMIIIPYIREGVDDDLNATVEENLISRGYNSYHNSSLLNINIATARELESLPGIGTILAERIVEYRKNNGIFRKVEDIKNVPGIGEKKYEAMKEMITTY